MSDWLRLLRPHQWVKNGFVLVGWLFGHQWHDPALLADVLQAFVAFCLVSSAVYAANDVADRKADQLHPRKRLRPVASGAIPVAAALVAAGVLAGIALWLAWNVSHASAGLIAVYAVLNIGYSLGLKHVAVLDVFIIASGFMLRLLVGTIGVGIAPSQWLLLCGLMVTLFLGFTKRRAEALALGDDPGAHRPSLGDYTPALLDSMITISAAGVLVTYSLYTVSPDTIALHGTDRLVLTLPFVMYGMFRFLLLLHARGGGGDPARDLLRDPHLAVSVIGWLATTMVLIRPF
jgi:4-hydroxybenzoate polyprenyltransferase